MFSFEYIINANQMNICVNVPKYAFMDMNMDIYMCVCMYINMHILCLQVYGCE